MDKKWISQGQFKVIAGIICGALAAALYFLSQQAVGAPAPISDDLTQRQNAALESVRKSAERIDRTMTQRNGWMQ